MTGWLTSFALAAATAQPAAAPPTISHQRVSPVCTTLHQVVLPLAQMNIKNRVLTDRMKSNVREIAKYRNTKLGDGIFLRLAQNDMYATNLLKNIHDVELQLLKSYAAYPQGKNAKVDALRQRVQNVIDLERTIANSYAAAYGSAVDNDGITGIEGSLDHSVGHQPGARETNSELPTGLASVINEDPPAEPSGSTRTATIADTDANLASVVPPGFSLRMLKYTRLSEIRSLMHSEGPALQQQALIAARDCDGM